MTILPRFLTLWPVDGKRDPPFRHQGIKDHPRQIRQNQNSLLLVNIMLVGILLPVRIYLSLTLFLTTTTITITTKTSSAPSPPSYNQVRSHLSPDGGGWISWHHGGWRSSCWQAGSYGDGWWLWWCSWIFVVAQFFGILQVDFLDLTTSEWRQLPSLNYKIGDADEDQLIIYHMIHRCWKKFGLPITQHDK